MKILKTSEPECLVRGAFPAKTGFTAGTDLGLAPARMPATALVHGGPDPYLDRERADWLAGGAAYIGLYPLLDRLCRAGAIAPGACAIMAS